MKINALILAATAVIITAGCSQDGNIRLTGRFAGHADEQIYLEQILPGNQQIIDSATLGKKGDFRMTLKPHLNQTTLYNLRYNNDVIPLLLSPGERVTVNSICDIGHNYTVEGSPESVRLRELKTLLEGGSATLDSLRSVIVSTTGEQQTNAYTEYVMEIQRVMREHISFIISQPHSLSSLYALYQRLPQQQYLLNQENDIIYYRMVADSTEEHHPGSPYVAALRKEIEDAESKSRLFSMISDKLAGEGDNYPDLNLPDMYGNKHTLSNLDGKVILLDFWVSTLSASKLNNAEMKKLYEEANGKGFEIYQVSLDTKKAEWVLAVQNQKLPWITVSDMLGERSPAARVYNINKVPTNFLIDRNGDIIARDLYGDELSRTVRKLL